MIASVDVMQCEVRGGQPRARTATLMELRHVHGWIYGVWTAVRLSAREAAWHDRLMLIEEAGEAAEWGLQ